MTELFLILSICACALAYVALVARWSASFRGVSNDIAKLVAAIERAGESLFGRQLRMSLVTALVLFPLVLGFAALSPLAGDIGAALAVLLSSLSYAACYGVCCVSAYTAARLTTRSVQAVHDALKRDLKGPSYVALRAGTASGILTDVASLLLVCAALGLMYALQQGGTPVTDAQTTRLLFVGLPSLSLGAIVASMSLQLSASAYSAAANLGSQCILDRENIPAEDSRNPALVSDLAGRQLSQPIALCGDAFSASVTAHSAILIAIALVMASAPQVFLSPVSVLMLPLILRAVGLVAAGFGAMSGHTDDSERPSATLWRVQASTGLVATTGTVGACIWCLGPDLWLPFSSCAALGITTAVLVARSAHGFWFSNSHVSTGTVSGRDTAGLGNVRSGLAAPLMPALVVSVGLAGTGYAGFSAPVAESPLFATAMFLSGYLTLGSSWLGASAFASIADSARGLCGFAGANRPGSETARRSTVLADTAIVAQGASNTYKAVLGALVLMLACTSLTTGDSAQVPASAQTMLLLSGAVLGSGFVFAHAGRVLSHARAVAGALTENLEIQLRAARARNPEGALTEEFTPSYQSCAETIEQASVRDGSRLIALPIVVPVVGALLLRFLCSPKSGSPVLVFTAFCLAVGATGMVCSMSTEVMRGLLTRQQLSGALPSPVTDVGSPQINFFGLITGPAIQSLVTATAAACLLIRPALH